MSLPYPEPPLNDGTIVLRPWQAEDLPVLERASRDPYLAEIEHLPPPFTEEAAKRWLARKQARQERAEGWELAVVELRSGGVVAGTGLTRRHPPGTAEPGIWVLPERRNEGIAQRAVGLLCRSALSTSELDIARIQATVEPWNIASQRVLERLGFQREGLLRSYASWRGARQDVYVYSLLETDLAAVTRPAAR